MSKVGQGRGAGGLAPGKVIDGRYRVVRLVGEGARSQVFEVEHLLTGRRLALKRPKGGEPGARLEQEARATASLRTPRAVEITDMALLGDAGPYLVMELLEGKSLRALLAESGKLSIDLTLQIGLQIGECLHEAHGRGVSHLHLDAERVFLLPAPGATPAAPRFDVKVLGFGAGSARSPGRSEPRVGASDEDARADIAALGALLYECLAGQRPSALGASGELAAPPEPLSSLRPELPSEISGAVMASLAPKEEARVASVLDLARRLAGHASGAEVLWIPGDELKTSKSIAPPRPPPRPGGRTVPLPGPPRAGSPPAPLPPRSPRLGQPPRAEPPAPAPSPIEAAPALESPLASSMAQDRNTPTEMFPSAETSPEPGPFRARQDTPTRTLDPIEAGLALGGAPPPDGDVEEHDEKTTAIGRKAAMAKAGLGPLPPELAGGAEDDPQATRPLPEGLALPPPPAAPLPPAFAPRPGADPAAPGLASPLAAAKPAWQLALDRTLVDLARRGERIAARASALPPTTRIAVIAGASFAVVFVCALLFVRYALS